MKRKITIAHFTGGATTATIVIDKNGLSVVDKSEHCSDSEVCRRFLKSLIDMDSWNHSWHMNLSSAQSKGSDERKKVREIINEKIKQREEEIQELKDGLQVLGHWNHSVR